jgi:methylmalonyl-CoA/ethylmalonyl-CoA epimerase
MPPLLPASAVDHVGIAAIGPESDLSWLIGCGEIAGRRMPSGVAVGRFGPESHLELVWPYRGGSPIETFLARRGPGLRHLAFRVEAPIEPLRERLLSASMRLIGDGWERSSDGRQCFFIHPRATGGVLIEVVEGERNG